VRAGGGDAPFFQMKERNVRRGKAVIIFLDTNPYRDATWAEVKPLLTQEQIDFIATRQWTDAEKLRQAQDFAEENTASEETRGTR